MNPDSYEVLELYGERVGIGTVLTEQMIAAIKYCLHEAIAYRELKARPDIARHELGLCRPIRNDDPRFA